MVLAPRDPLGPERINVAALAPRTEAEGPGARYAIWVQGCPLRCAGCCNPHMLADRAARILKTEALADEIAATDGIEGVTFVGGEPFWQASALAVIAQRARAAGLGVMIFTGQTIERIRRAGRPDWDALLGACDLLIDGPYIASKRESGRRWIGSSNQRAHFLTARYASLRDSGWEAGPNTIELRLSRGELSINGFPAQSVTELALSSIRPIDEGSGR